MGVIRGLVTGFTLAGAVTFAYQQNIYSSSNYLRNALTSLSKELDSLRIQSRVDDIPREPVSLENLSLGEQVKQQVRRACIFSFAEPGLTVASCQQWNAQLLRGVDGLYTTNWSQVAQRAWTVTQMEAKAIKDRLSA